MLVLGLNPHSQLTVAGPQRRWNTRICTIPIELLHTVTQRRGEERRVEEKRRKGEEYRSEKGMMKGEWRGEERIDKGEEI